MKFSTSFRSFVYRTHLAFADKRLTVRAGTRKTIFTLCITVGAYCLLTSTLHAAPAEKDLQASITTLSNKLSASEATVTLLKADIDNLVETVNLVNANHSILLVSGVSSGTAGGSVQIPITFVPSTWQATAFQAEIVLPAGFTLKGLTIGPAAITANKNVQLNPANGRFLVFGLNQTVLEDGVVAIATVNIATGTHSGIYPFALSNPVATDANGSAALDIVTLSGEIKL